MRYFSTAMFWPTNGKTRYVEVGYIEDKQFMHFDSNWENPR